MHGIIMHTAIVVTFHVQTHTHTHTLHDVVQHIYCNIQKHRTLMILLQASIATGTGSNRSPHQVHAKHAWGIVQSKQLIGLH